MRAHLQLRVFILIAVVGLLVQACGSAPATQMQAPTQSAASTTQPATDATQPAAATTAGLVAVKVVTLPFISFAPFYIAQEEGFFKEQGLDVELVNMTVQQEIVPALASGQVDVSSGLLSAGILNTIAKGAKIQIVADKGYIDPKGCPNIGLVARRSLVESGVADNPASLKGKNFALVRTTWLDYFAEKLLNTVDLKVEDLAVTDLPSAAQPEALTNGALDLVMQNEPWVTRFIQAGHKPILTPVQELMPDSQSAVTLYGPKLLGENADTGNRFMVAYLKAVRQYNEGKTDRNIEILAKSIQLEPALLKEMCWPTLQNDGKIKVESVLDFQKWAVDKKFMQQSVTAEQFWNPSFAEYAAKQVGASGQ